MVRRLATTDMRDPSLLTIVAAAVLCAFATAAIGTHEIFGAFMFGAIFPPGQFRDRIRDRLQSVGLLLLPFFFVTTGLQVEITDLSSSALWQLPLILLVAFAGKIGAVYTAARCKGVKAPESLALGVLMNTRGLTELVVLGIGRELNIIDAQLFSLLVIMAIVTTVTTAPLLEIILRRQLARESTGSARSTPVENLHFTTSPTAAASARQSGLHRRGSVADAISPLYSECSDQHEC
jgi:Kef-type K+ transport system membrane component KefB